MKARCPSCGSALWLSDAGVAGVVRSVRCGNCGGRVELVGSSISDGDASAAGPAAVVLRVSKVSAPGDAPSTLTLYHDASVELRVGDAEVSARAVTARRVVETWEQVFQSDAWTALVAASPVEPVEGEAPPQYRIEAAGAVASLSAVPRAGSHESRLSLMVEALFRTVVPR